MAKPKLCFPNGHLTTVIDSVLQPQRQLPRKIHSVHSPLVLYNSQWNLFAQCGFPKWYEPNDQPFDFLRYRDWCGDGKYYNDVRIQHLGHKHGVLGGDVLVALSYRGITWTFELSPCRLYFIVDFGEYGFALCLSNRFVVLPKPLIKTS